MELRNKQAIIVSDKMDFELKLIIRDKEEETVYTYERKNPTTGYYDPKHICTE